MKIAICDDDKMTVTHMSKTIKKILAKIYDLDVVIDDFLSPTDMLHNHNIHPYDVVFADLEMPEMHGFEVSKHLQKKHKDTIIIFVTSHTNFVFDSFEVNPFRFVPKKDFGSRITQILIDTVEKYKNTKEIYMFSYERKGYAVRLSKIIYFEYKRGTVNIITEDGTIYRHRRKMNDIEKELSEQHFIRTHSGYIVNAAHVSGWGADFVRMADDTKVPMSRLKEPEVKRQLALYVREINRRL